MIEIKLTYWPPTGASEGEALSIEQHLTCETIKRSNLRIVPFEAERLFNILVDNSALLQEELK